MKTKHAKFFLFLSILVVMLCTLSLHTFAADGDVVTDTWYHKMPGYTEYFVSGYDLPHNTTVILSCYDDQGKIKYVVPQTYAFGNLCYIVPDCIDYDTVKIFSLDKTSTMTISGQAEILAAPDVSDDVSELVIHNLREHVEDAQVNGGEVSLSYYESMDDDLPVELSFAAASRTILYVNNILIGDLSTSDAIDVFESIYDGEYSYATLWDTDGDGEFDEIYLTSYIYGMVRGVDPEREIIETTDGSMYYLSNKDTSSSFIYTIHKNGQVVGLDALERGDMLNMVFGELSENSTDAVFVDIFVSNNVLDATITSVRSMWGYKVCNIDNTEYYSAKNALYADPAPGDVGRFYLTIDGYIYDAKLENVDAQEKYAFIMGAGCNQGAFGNCWQIKILDETNTLRILTVKPSYLFVSVDGGQTMQTLSGNALDVEMNRIKSLIVNSYETEDAGTNVEALASDRAAAVRAIGTTLKDRFIKFKEQNGEITELIFSSDAANYRHFNISTLCSAYNEKNGRLGNYVITEETVFFNLPLETAITKEDVYLTDRYVLDVEKIKLCDKSALYNNETYNGYCYSVSGLNLTGAVFLTDDLGFSGKDNALAVVSSCSTGLNANGCSATVLTFLQENAVTSLAISDDYFGETNPGLVSCGDVIQYIENGRGEIVDLIIVYDYEEKSLQTRKTVGDISYAVGFVTNYTHPAVVLENSGGDKTYTIGSEIGTNAFVNTARMGKRDAFSFRGNFSHLVPYKADASNQLKSCCLVVLRMYKGVVVDAVTYLYPEESVYGITPQEFIASIKG